MIVADRPVLALDDLEAVDPQAPRGGRERRFCCPLPACADMPRDAEHRNLSLNVETGAFVCYRCGGAGQLREHWRPPASRRREIARRAFGLATAVVAAPSTPPENRGGTGAPRWDWRAPWDATTDLAGTPGQAYLEGRGIPLAVAAAAGVRYAASWAGHPAVVFPVADRAGGVRAAQGRYLRDDVSPTKRTGGPSKLGVFATPGALEAETIVVVEAPIDALSLHVAGVPAVALLGTNAADWLAAAVAFKRVALALDADAAGEEKVAALAARLGAFGATVERWRPAGVKDWNDALRQHGAVALRAALTGTVVSFETAGDESASEWSDERVSNETGNDEAPAAVLGVDQSTVVRDRRIADAEASPVSAPADGGDRSADANASPVSEAPADDVDGLLDGQAEEPPAEDADELGPFLEEYADDELDEEPAPEPMRGAVSDALVERVLTVFPAVGWRTVDDVAHDLAVTKPAALVAVRALAAVGTIERSPRVRGGTGLWRRPAEPVGEEARHG